MSHPFFTHSKIISPGDIKSRRVAARAEGKTVATLNGSFDLLHAGHLQIIFAGKDEADILCVALNSDESIRTYKGEDRPIIPLEYRLEMMAALAPVDWVTWFDETDPRAILREIHPDVHVNGEEYGADCIEKGVLDEIGARLHLVPRVPSLATSAIIEKIKGI